MAITYVVQCLDPEQPGMQCQTTPIFGAPKGRTGRALPNTINELPVSGISLHCIKDTFDGYLAKACIGSTKPNPLCQGSFHYVVDADTGRISSLVDENNVAWSWQSYKSNFPVTTPLEYCPCPDPCPSEPCGNPPQPQVYTGWPVLSGQFPNISADFYTINIGITTPFRPEQSAVDNVDCCFDQNGDPRHYGLSTLAYKNLIKLLAWIQSRYPAILLDPQHIAFHDDIVITEDQCRQCPCTAKGACLICDISNYCQTCDAKLDPTIKEVTDGIRFILAESTSGCRVKISLENLKAQLDLLD